MSQRLSEYRSSGENRVKGSLRRGSGLLFGVGRLMVPVDRCQLIGMQRDPRSVDAVCGTSTTAAASVPTGPGTTSATPPVPDRVFVRHVGGPFNISTVGWLDFPHYSMIRGLAETANARRDQVGQLKCGVGSEPRDVCGAHESSSCFFILPAVRHFGVSIASHLSVSGTNKGGKPAL